MLASVEAAFGWQSVASDAHVQQRLLAASAPHDVHAGECCVTCTSVHQAYAGVVSRHPS